MPAYLPQLAFQPYIQPNTGGEPIKELSDLGTSLNSAYNTSIAQQDALDEHMAQLQATLSPVDHPLLDTIQQQTRGDLADIKKNGNYENAQMPLRAAARRLLTNPALLTAQMNAQTRQKLEDLKTQAQAQGHHIIQYQDYNNTPSVDANGNLQKLSLDGVFDKKLDYLSKMQQVFQGLEASSSAYKDSKPERDESTGAIYQIGQGASRRFVNSKTINNIVSNNLDNYLQTDEGQQHFKVLTTKNSDNPTALSPQQAKAQIAHDLTMTGFTHRFSDVSQENSERLAPGKQQASGDGTVAVQDTAVPINQDFSNLKESLEKKDRSVSPILAAMATPVGGGSPYSDALNNSPDKTPKYDDKTLQKSDLYKSMFKLYSQSLGTSNPDKINPLIKDYLGKIEKGGISPILHATYDPKQMKADNGFLQNGAVKSLPIYDQSTGKKYDSMSEQKFKDDYPDIKPEDYSNATVVGKYDQDHPFADVTGDSNYIDSRKISIKGHDFVAGGFAQDKRSSTYLDDYLGNKVSSSRRNGIPVTLTNGKNNMKVFSKGDGTYLIQGKDSKGNDLPIVPLSLEQAKTYLSTSGYTTQK